MRMRGIRVGMVRVWEIRVGMMEMRKIRVEMIGVRGIRVGMQRIGVGMGKLGVVGIRSIRLRIFV